MGRVERPPQGPQDQSDHSRPAGTVREVLYPSMPNPMRVLLAEDHFVTRMGLKAILSAERDIEIVAESETGPDTIALFRTHRPDVAIVDLRLPGLSGVEVIKEIRAEFRDARIVVLTASDGSEDVY